MDPLAVVARLAAIAPRGAAGDGERRAAVWLRDTLRTRGREAALQTVWVRPQWPLAAAMPTALALAGSITSVWRPAIGLGLLAAALAALAGDVSGRAPLLRKLLPERATQNVVSPPRATAGGRVTLVITANTDAGRAGAIYADRWVRLEGRLRRAAGGHLPSPLGALTLAVAGLVALAALRTGGTAGAALSTVQFVLTVPVVVALAILLDIALSDVSPGANANASGVAVALALADALDEAPLQRLDVALVFAGAGEGDALGMRAFVAQRRRRWRPEDVIVLAVEPCGAGTPYWLERDGRLLGRRFHPQLRELMATIAGQERQLHARPLRSHGISGAFAARLRGWPAIAVGCADELGRASGARQASDVPGAVDAAALEATLELCLAFVGALDRSLAASAERAAV
jgi:hypothetical protein